MATGQTSIFFHLTAYSNLLEVESETLGKLKVISESTISLLQCHLSCF